MVVLKNTIIFFTSILPLHNLYKSSTLVLPAPFYFPSDPVLQLLDKGVCLPAITRGLSFVPSMGTFYSHIGSVVLPVWECFAPSLGVYSQLLVLRGIQLTQKST